MNVILVGAINDVPSDFAIVGGGEDVVVMVSFPRKSLSELGEVR